MKIKIVEKNKLLSSDYEIFVQGKLKYHISWKGAFRILDNKDEIQLTAKKKWNLFRINPKLELNDLTSSTNWILDFKGDLEYALIGDEYTIDFYHQIGRKVGLFINDTQVGYSEKNKVSKLGNDTYELVINNELDRLPIIAVIIAYNSYVSPNNNDTLHHTDYGNLNIEPKQKINSNWTPKK